MKRLLILLIIGLIFAHAALPTRPGSGASLAEKLAYIDEVAEYYLIKQNKTPGYSIALVPFKGNASDTHYLSKGYADIENKVEVTQRTFFGIGSVSKHFTSTLFGAEADKINIDEPMINYCGKRLRLPDQMRDATFRDALTHRLTWGAYMGDYLWMITGENLTEAELLSRVGLLPNTVDYRLYSQYNNMGVLLAAYCATEFLGTEYKQWLDDVMAKGDVSLTLQAQPLLDRGDEVALGYARTSSGGFTDAIPVSVLDSTLPPIAGPAGGIWASAEVMGSYLRGLFDSKFHTFNIMLHYPFTTIPSLSGAFVNTPCKSVPIYSPGKYYVGCGEMMVGMHDGNTFYHSHTLAVAPTDPQYTTVAENGWGISIATNVEGANLYVEPVMVEALAVLTDSNVPVIDVPVSASPKEKSNERFSLLTDIDLNSQQEQAVANGCDPSQEFSYEWADMAGVYTHSYYGNVTITHSPVPEHYEPPLPYPALPLEMTYGNSRVRLLHCHYGVTLMGVEEAPVAALLSGGIIRFMPSFNGPVTALRYLFSASDPRKGGVFTRGKVDPPTVTPHPAIVEAEKPVIVVEFNHAFYFIMSGILAAVVAAIVATITCLISRPRKMRPEEQALLNM